MNRIINLYNRRMITRFIRGYIKRFHFYKPKGRIILGKGCNIFFKSVNFIDKIIINDFVRITGSRKSITFGSNCNIGSFTTIKADFSKYSFFSAGDNFSCGEFCFFGSAGGIHIGNNVMIAQNVRIHAQQHIYTNKNELIRNQGTIEKQVNIGDDCWIGSGVVIQAGVKIGNGVVVGSNSVVTKSIDDYSVVVGNPAHTIKMRI